MKRNPFQPKYRAKKPKTDKEFKDGRIRLADKGELREKVFERSGGKCEEVIPDSDIIAKRLWFPEQWRCNAPITLQSMELSHKRHGCHRDDTAASTIASCKECHRVKHASRGIPRRPGKPMKIKDAKAYWEGEVCFCDGNKRKQESFCPECRVKLQPQTLYDLENSDDPDAYRMTLAQAENEVLMYGK